MAEPPAAASALAESPEIEAVAAATDGVEPAGSKST
jgi:hypothetical protein